MNTKELEKSKAHITVEIIEYVPNSVVIKTILKKVKFPLKSFRESVLKFKF